MRKALTLSLVVTCLASPALARDYVRMAGSSTVFPFAAMASEEFSRITRYKNPIVESTGTGGGFKFFCEGIGQDYPDFANASRPITEGERENCKKHGVNRIIELPLGYDGIVLANKRGAAHYNLSQKQMFLALAAKVPVNGKLVNNPYRRWKEVDASLPDAPIEVYGPSTTSGTRDAFVELVMHKGCEEFSEFEKEYPDKKNRKAACGMIREDEAYLVTGENDNLIIQKLNANPDGLGIFGYSFLEENQGFVQGSRINGVEPSAETIASGQYAMSRIIYTYAKGEHLTLIPGMKEFMQELTSERALDPVDGYMVEKGLIPLPTEKREEVRAGLPR
ncbi:phosphate ABC transporter substrate-binding protein [bacterium]|nr:phosphate ABC transporter substrate-binding protein [bacterium]